MKDSESILPQLGTAFTAEWNGKLKIVKRAKYTIVVQGNADTTIAVDGRPIAGEPIDLDLGDHPIKIEFTRKPGAARLQLMWSADDFAQEPVPSSVLFHPSASTEAAQQSKVEAGQLLVEELNCVACHRSLSTALSPRSAPELSTVGTRLHAAWIDKWLQDPRAFRPTASMPHPPLKADERRDIAAYLATLKNPATKVKEPQHSVTRIETGKTLFETVGCTACHGGKKGNSLDGLGSKWLPGQLADFLLNPQSVDHSGRMPSMLLQTEEALSLAEYLVQSRNAAFEAKPAPGDVKHGEQLLQSQGCLNCHTANSSQGQPLATTAPEAVSLEKLTVLDRGCLAEQPSGRAMDYGLTPPQRDLIGAFIASVREHPMATAAPVYAFYHKTKALGCINCHELDASVPADATERVPQLTNVGGRLRVEWIGEVLTQKRRVRPWLRRRMPEFGPNIVGDVPGLAIAASGAGQVEPLPIPTRDEITAGQKLLGTGAGGFGCITCHGFAGAKPNVIDDTRGPDITTVASRLRPDHFRRWVLDPKRVSPSTPMPSFFDGVPVAEAAARVETMFRYVAAGENMPPPVGWVDKNNYQVAIRDEPIVLRTFMPGSDGQSNFPRGIAVGLPGLVSYCFDAETCTLRYAWTGGFLDMQPSWAARGGGIVKVLGKRFYTNAIFPFRNGDFGAEPAPEFQGYSLVNHMPQFSYRLGDGEVRETIMALEKGLGLVRAFEMDSGGKPISFIAIDEPGVSYASSSGSFEPMEITVPGTHQKVPGRILKLKGGSAVKFSVTITAKESK